MGVDSSAEMVERALADGVGPRLRFEVADLREWEPDAPVDVRVNGCLVAKGEVVVIDGEFGVRVTAVVER